MAGFRASTQAGKRTATAWIVALTAIGSLMAALDTLVVSTSLSTIRLDLGASLEDLEWTVNAYNLSFAVLLITAAAALQTRQPSSSAPRFLIVRRRGLPLCQSGYVRRWKSIARGGDSVARRGGGPGR
jgi:MFS family permease